MCNVPRPSQARTTERSSVSARLTSAAVSRLVRARSARRAACRSWACTERSRRTMSAGDSPRGACRSCRAARPRRSAAVPLLDRPMQHLELDPVRIEEEHGAVAGRVVVLAWPVLDCRAGLAQPVGAPTDALPGGDAAAAEV